MLNKTLSGNRICSNMTLPLLLVVALSISVTGCASKPMTSISSIFVPQVNFSMSPKFVPENIETIAVIAEDRSGSLRRNQLGFLRSIEDSITVKLFEKGFRVAARRDAEAVEEELKILTDDEIVALGRILGADVVMIASITDVSTSSERKAGRSGESINIITGERSRYRTSSYTEYTADVALSVRIIALNRETLGSATYRTSRTSRRTAPVEQALTTAATRMAAAFPSRFAEK
jgi:hypothetical protein